MRPKGCKIARYYCPLGHTTFGLVPDCLASRLSSTLSRVEEVARVVETAQSLEQAAEALRPDIQLPGAVRWVRRRAQAVRALFKTLVTLFSWECAPTVLAVSERIERPEVLVAVREIAKDELAVLPPYVGFGPRLRHRCARDGPSQQEPGADATGLGD